MDCKVNKPCRSARQLKQEPLIYNSRDGDPAIFVLNSINTVLLKVHMFSFRIYRVLKPLIFLYGAGEGT